MSSHDDHTPPPSLAPETPIPPPTGSPPKAPLKQRLTDLMDAYGPVAIGTWLVIFGLTLGGFAAAIKLGFTTDSAAGQTGVLAAAYLATQATKPLRIVATLAATPVVARLLGR